MTEILSFIMGAMFCLTLVLALLPLMRAAPVTHDATPRAVRSPLAGVMAQTVAQTVAQGPRGGSRTTDAAARRARIEARAAKAGPASEPGTRFRPDAPYRDVSTRQEREIAALRIALEGIARGREPASAKIAAQTLRRIDGGAEPPMARIAFARARLELLSLGQDPRARAMASAVLSRAA